MVEVYVLKTHHAWSDARGSTLVNSELEPHLFFRKLLPLKNELSLSNIFFQGTHPYIVIPLYYPQICYILFKKNPLKILSSPQFLGYFFRSLMVQLLRCAFVFCLTWQLQLACDRQPLAEICGVRKYKIGLRKYNELCIALVLSHHNIVHKYNRWLVGRSMLCISHSHKQYTATKFTQFTHMTCKV